ncbi:MAG: type II toxin-antitoxin system HicB family antitoxin [Dehalococcoidia bacterium]|nr:type II toxin-antitoxin system HicB family antitoxin [Dehalococcoidia bacterium]
MEYVFPAVFHANDDNGSYTITYPDLPGCISEGKSLGNAMYMAQSALSQWLSYLEEKGEKIPSPSSAKSIMVEAGEFTNLIRAEVKDARAVRRTVSIPKWQDEKATKARLSLSRVLQDALNEKLPV